jgi:hypothetical protein
VGPRLPDRITRRVMYAYLWWPSSERDRDEGKTRLG